MDESSASTVAGRPQAEALDVIEPLLAIRGWIRFLGWLAIIAGAINCLSIVGLVYGWIPIWIGVLLLRSVDALERGSASGNAHELRAGVQSLAKAIQVKAVLALVGIVLSLMGLVLLALMAIGFAVQNA